MRRMTAMLTVCLCAVAGCRGGAAQEPYDGVLGTAKRPPTVAERPAARGPEAEPIASEVDAPWAIALLADAKSSVADNRANVMVVDRQPDFPEAVVDEDDLHVAVGPRAPDEKPAAPKSCNGVVKSRS